MADNFRDAHDSQIAGVNYGVAPSRPHTLTADSKEFQGSVFAPQRVNKLRAIEFTRGFPRRDQNAHTTL
jgi:hypothetical protein